MKNVSAGFQPPCWCLSGWAPAWRLMTNRYKLGGKGSPNILHKKNCCDLNLGDSVCIFTFFFSRILHFMSVLKVFDCFILIYFEWRDTKTSNYRLQMSPSKIDLMTTSLNWKTSYYCLIEWLGKTQSIHWPMEIFWEQTMQVTWNVHKDTFRITV